MRQFKIFLSSPQDTFEERKLAEEVVAEINRTIGSRDEFHLYLLKWENNTYPSIGEDGQDVISKQIGGDYQIFIGLMWKKFGTPTKRAGSGTEEEFELAYNRYLKNKDIQIMFYFNGTSIPQDSNLDDFQKVLSFKKKIEGLGAYHFTYQNAKRFEKLLREHLTGYIKDFLKTETKKEETIGVAKTTRPIAIEIKPSFKMYLNDMEATFAHSNVDKVYFDDIYISPDLQKLKNNQKTNINKTVKLSSLTDAIEEEGIKYILLGNELAGKTASCKFVFQKYFNQSLIPVIIKGEEINNNIKIETIEKIIEKNIINQYEYPFLLSEIDCKKILIIIDDFHKSAKGLNRYWHTLIRNIESKFSNIIITGSPLMTIDKDYNEPFKNFTLYLILEFGPVLRKELVHKWKNLKVDEKYVDKNELLRKEDEALLQIKTAIGKNYFPVYPFYILSMLQALEGNTVSNPNYSIHGFYYENLISRCFSKFITNKKEINLFYNYLTYFCYYLFDKQVKELTIQEFKDFHILYCKKVDIVYSVEKIMQTFDDASLLSINHKVHVKEKYVFYFFVAKYLADNINNDPNVKGIISKMSIRIFRDDYANIILFITHLSKDKFIIEELIKNANSIFSNVEPAKLADDIKGINTLVENIPKQVLEAVDVDKKREEELIEEEETEQYEREYENEKTSYNNFGLEDDISTIDFLAWLTMTFKTIDILGQIAKKHWGDMDGNLKIKLVNATYNLGLRFLGYYLQLLQNNQTEIVEHLTRVFNSKSFKDKYSLKKSIEEETKDYIFKLCFMATFGTTKRISSSVSDVELKLTFAKILEDNPTNSVQLIDIGIKLIYSGLPIQQIKELKDTMDKNHLCTMVLQHLIIDHSYMFEINHIERSKINSIFGTEIKEQLLIDTTSKVKRN